MSDDWPGTLREAADAWPGTPIEAQKPMSAGETTADIIKSGGTGLEKAAIGAAGLQGDIASMGERVVKGGARALGLAPTPGSTYETIAHGLTKARHQFLPNSAEVQQAVEQATGTPLYKPKTGLGELAETAGEFAPAVFGGEGSLLAKAATRVALPALGAEAAQTVAPEPLKPYAKAIGAVTAGGIGAGIQSAVRAVREPMANVAADLSRAMLRDNDTPEALSQRLAEAKQIRPEATIADVAKENVLGLTERISQTPGAGRTIVNPALSARQRNQAQRLSTDLADLTGSSQSAFSATNEAIAARSSAAEPLYRQAYEDGDRVVWSPELGELSNSSSVKTAMKIAVRDWRDSFIADKYGASNPIPAKGGPIPVVPNLQFWDYTKRAMDDMVSAAFRGGQNDRGRVLAQVTRNLRNQLDKEVPSYADARQAWGGPSQYMDAIEEGRGILSKNITSEELKAQLADMTDAQREGYRIGAVSAIRNQMRGNAAKFADHTRTLRSDEMREKLAAIMPTPEAAQNFEQRLNYEVHSSETTNRALGNSATARRQAEMDAGEGLGTEMLMGLLSHGTHAPLKFLKSALMSVPQHIRDTLRSRSDAILADLLVNPQSAGRMGQVMQGVGPRPPALGAAAVPALTYGESGQRASGGRVGFDPSSIGARKAKNGHWFINDPSRPGKYLLVLPKGKGGMRWTGKSSG